MVDVSTYSVSSLAAALQPDTRVLGNGSRVELDPVVTANSQLPLALLSLDVPTSDSLVVCLLGNGRGQHGPRILEHVDVSASLVTSGGDNQVDIQQLLV